MNIDVARLEEVEREKQREEHIELTLQKVKNKKSVDELNKLNLTDNEWDIIRQESLSSQRCAICGEKLHTSCFAEDSFSVECVNCDILFYED